MWALLPAILAGASSATVSLSGETITDSDLHPGTVTAYVIINSDGTIDKTEDITTSQIDNATDWIIPNSAGGGGYEVRYTGHSGDALTAEAASENTWIALSSDRTYGIQHSQNADKTATFTIEIRRGSTGGAIASASYTTAANNT